MSDSPDILFVDDELHLRNAVSQSFDLADLSHMCFARADELLPRVSRDFGGIVITDIRMPETSGMDLLTRLLDVDFELPVVLITGHGDVKLAVEAMQMGAYDFIEKPFDPKHLVEVARRALDKRRLTLENRTLRTNVTNRDPLETRLTGRTPVMVELRRIIRAIADTDIDVLVTGETGAGKEVVARAIHSNSARAEQAFVAINCGAISDDQLDSELFGHEQGAFTGAFRTRIGKFERARGGTIFLDEIESASPQMQAKLSRILEERAISRMGGSEVIDLDVRFIAAAKKDLTAMDMSGDFREDLHHRLSGVILKVPSLEERKADIPRLFTQLANEAARKYRRPFADVPNSVLSSIMAAEWPGNVRQLKNAADRFVLGLNEESAREQPPTSLANRITAFEREVIAAELTAQQGKLKETHEALGISRKSLYEKMQKHGLNKNDFRKT